MDGRKILVITGSPRAQSVSAALCSALLTGADTADEVKTYNAYALAAQPCIACCYCETHRGCALHDLDEFMADFEEADFVVIAAPVYNGGLPAPLKAIIDRFQRYYALRFAHNVSPTIKKQKKAALILTAGHNGEGYENIQNSLQQQFTVLNTELERAIMFCHTDSREPSAQVISQISQDGKTFFIPSTP